MISLTVTDGRARENSVSEVYNSHAFVAVSAGGPAAATRLVVLQLAETPSTIGEIVVLYLNPCLIAVRRAGR